MALGAAKMAREYHCIITSLPALQDISSMTILCSDKTGTLTTAHITICSTSVWVNSNSGFTAEDLAFYGGIIYMYYSILLCMYMYDVYLTIFNMYIHCSYQCRLQYY